MKLFAIYIGGEMPGANIEVHDMRFVAASSLQATYDELRRQWWGDPASLHVDCWAELDHVQGFDVALSSEPFAGPERLFYVNLGGYDRQHFIELHRNAFVVAPNAREAKRLALAEVENWRDAHRDELYEAEQVFALDSVASEHRLHIHLTPAATARPLRFACKYTPLGK